MTIQSNLPGLTKWLNPNQTQDKSSQDLTGLLQAKQQADQLAKQAEGRAQDQFVPSSKAKQLASAQSVSSALQYSQTMTLNLETREGDKVAVDFRQLYEQYASYSEMKQAEQGPQGVRYFESRQAMEMAAFEERFAFSVEGDLNEEELAAIADVFQQVDSLANEFYNGNIEKAFEQAMALNMDFGQLKSLDLNMEKSMTQAVSYQQAAMSQYQSVQQADEDAADYGVDLGDLPPYLQAWQDAIARLDEQFANARSAFDDMMGGTLAQRFGDQDSPDGWLARVSKLHEGLANWAAQATPANATNDNSAVDAQKV
jgi:hypothetical protein